MDIVKINRIRTLGLALLVWASLLVAGCSAGTTAAQLAGTNEARTVAAFQRTAKSSVTVRITQTTSGLSVKLSCTGTTLSEGTLFFTNGTSVKRSLSGTSGTITSSNKSLWYVRAKTGGGDYWYFDKSGDYWYFDHSGTWKPSSTTTIWRSTSHSRRDYDDDDDRGRSTTFVSTVVLTDTDEQLSITFDGSEIAAESTLGLEEVEVVCQGADQTCRLNGDRDSAQLYTRVQPDYYVLVTADGSEWVFDAEGNHVPPGHSRRNQRADKDDDLRGRGHRRGW